MSQDYLAPKQTTAIPPAADKNVAAISSCCLDVNAKSAYIMKGRGGGVWWMIWMLIGSLVFIFQPLGHKTYYDLFEVAIALPLIIIIFGLGILRFVYIWHAHIPIRFNRQTRKVYLHHKKKTYILDWDTIRAYLALQKGTTAQGVPLRDPQVNIEFKDEAGKPLTLLLMGTQKAGLDPLQGAAALWEYIRVFMEEGPEGLPAPEPWVPDLNSYQEILDINNPFPIYFRRWWAPFDLTIFFPLRVLWFVVTYPTDLIYYQLEKRLKVKPFPLELEEPCHCHESLEEQKQRVADVLQSYDSRIEALYESVRNIELALLVSYTEWFVSFRYPGSAYIPLVDGIPQGWFRIPLTDLVELNPPLNISAEGEIPFVNATALPEKGMLIERDKLAQCNATDSDIFFRNGDVLFPLTSPQMDKGQAAIVSFLSGYEVANDNGDIIKLLSGYEVGVASADLVVMRGVKISPGLTFCLATDPRVRESLKDHLVNSPDEKRIPASALEGVTVSMPPLKLLEEFEKKSAKPFTKRIMQLEMEAQFLLNQRNRLLTNTASLFNHSSSLAPAPPAEN